MHLAHVINHAMKGCVQISILTTVTVRLFSSCEKKIKWQDSVKNRWNELKKLSLVLLLRNTVNNQNSIWKQFEVFLKEKHCELGEITSNAELGLVMKDWDFNMKKLSVSCVIWLGSTTFPTSVECTDALKQRGKKVHYVTNNPIVSSVELWKKLVREGFSAGINDVVNPIMSVISYLKMIKFNKKLFFVGSQQLRTELGKENFKMAPDPPQFIEESLAYVINHIADDEDIGAVILSWDLNQTFIKLQKVITYLKRKDCLFLLLAADKDAPVGPMGPLVVNEYIIRMLEEFTGRKPILVGKPSEYYSEFTNNTFGITDPKRAIFIGDQIDPDMRFANMGGYQKLLVLTGITKIEDINNWRHPEEYKPDYYVESLDVLNKILKSTK